MHQKRLATGLRQDPLEELKSSPRAPIRRGFDRLSTSEGNIVTS